VTSDAALEALTSEALRAFRRALRRKGPGAALAVLVAPQRGATAAAAAEFRRRVTRDDPLAFALLYMRHHLRNERAGSPVTLSEVHLAWVDAAAAWLEPSAEPYAYRRAEVAPRETGKSTWWFLVLPAWAAAHGHARFAAAFADTGTQAETHLASFKSELDNNALLREDYPDLCAPKTRGRGTVEADRVSLYHARSGFVFAAAGMDSSNLGLKVGNRRPDLIILDDIEPHEARYSSALAAKRLDTLRSAILPLNIYARVIFVGTVTMQGSIVHQLVEAARRPEVAAEWVKEERIAARHFPAIMANDDGSRRSAWPEKWSLSFLESIEHTRTYAKNYANDPLGADGDYWAPADFVREELPGTTRRLLSVDPAITTRASSDFTGLAVVGWRPAPAGSKGPGRCRVEAAHEVKLSPDALRERVLALIEQHDVGLVLVEVNQGGDLWPRILWGLPVPIKTVHQSVKKEVRAASVLTHYQRGRVLHAPGLARLEGQLVAFPNAPHDDMVDAVGSGVAYFLDRKPRTSGISVEQGAYV
jgi:predicted phage terminase large subunit-like protein